MGYPSIDISCPTIGRYTFYTDGQVSMTLNNHTDFTRMNGAGGKFSFSVDPMSTTAEGEPATVKFKIRNTSGYPIAFSEHGRGYMFLKDTRDFDKDRVYEVNLTPGVEYDYVAATEEQIKEEKGDLLAQSFVAQLSYQGAKISCYEVSYVSGFETGIAGGWGYSGVDLALESDRETAGYENANDSWHLKLNSYDDNHLDFYFEALGDGGFLVHPNTSPKRWLGITKNGYAYCFDSWDRGNRFYLRSPEGGLVGLYDLDGVGNKVYLDGLEVNGALKSFFAGSLNRFRLNSYGKKAAGDFWWSWLASGGGEEVLFDIKIIGRGVKASYDGGSQG